MTREEFGKVAGEYRSKFKKEMPVTVPLDFGHIDISDDDLCSYAKAAIASGKPINWREILGPTLYDRDPMLVS